MEKLVGLAHTKQEEEVLSEKNMQLQVLQQVTAAVHSSLDLEEVFKKVTDGAVHFLGYTTALILTLNNEKRCFGVKAFSTKKRLLSQINKILRFPINNLSIPADPKLNPVIGSVMNGNLAVIKGLAEIAYPILSKKACSSLQKLGGAKNYILVPLKDEKETVGAIFISSPRQEVSEEELGIIETFAKVSSDAIKNASLLIKSKQAEEALQQSEKSLKTYLESAPDGVYINDLKGTFIYGNKKAEELTGYKREEIIGKGFLKLNLLPMKHLAKAAKLLALNTIGKSTGPDEFELTRKDGSRIWVEINTTPIKQAGGTIVIGFVRDITERRLVDEKLRQRTHELGERVKELACLSGIGQLVAKTGANLDEILKETIDLISPSWQYPEITCARITFGGKEFKTNNFKTTEWKQSADINVNGCEKGSVEVYYLEKRPEAEEGPFLKEEADLINNIARMLSETAERKQAEEREKQLQQELNVAGRLASIGEMASGIAHEINNPLTSIIGFAQLLMSRDIPDDAREDLKVIDSEAQRVAEVVAGLLAFAHQRKPGREHVDINELILEVLKLRSYEMQVNNIQAVTQLTPDLPKTMADGNQFQQVFINIILNAEQAMIKAYGGKLSIKTEKVKDSIRASFTDDGPGISKENLDKVFNPFFTTREVGQGTGLGLSICHGIVTQHNGRIYADSKLGKGATFVVELPIVADASLLVNKEAIEEAIPEREGVKVLVVDDEKAILTLLSHLLTEWEYEVETVNNANDALDRLRSERYDLILMDIKMPVISGMELYRQIEAMDPALTQRVMFITGDVMGKTTGDFLGETGVPYITKPFHIEHLKNSITQILTKELVSQG